MKIKCVIADDEKYAVQVLNDYITRTPGLSLVAECRDGFEVIDVFDKNTIDILFLDVQMPQLSGLDVIRELKQRPSHIILTTAHQQYALDAFELAVFDYLLKPFSYDRFLKSLARLNRDVPRDPEYVFVKIDRTSVRFNVEYIRYIKAEGNYLRIYLPDRFEMVYMSLAEIQMKLPKSKFIQIHKSYVVAISAIQTVKYDSVSVGDKELPVGRLYKSQLNRVNGLK